MIQMHSQLRDARDRIQQSERERAESEAAASSCIESVRDECAQRVDVLSSEMRQASEKLTKIQRQCADLLTSEGEMKSRLDGEMAKSVQVVCLVHFIHLPWFCSTRAQSNN